MPLITFKSNRLPAHMVSQVKREMMH